MELDMEAIDCRSRSHLEPWEFEVQGACTLT